MLWSGCEGPPGPPVASKPVGPWKWQKWCILKLGQGFTRKRAQNFMELDIVICITFKLHWSFCKHNIISWTKRNWIFNKFYLLKRPKHKFEHQYDATMAFYRQNECNLCKLLEGKIQRKKTLKETTIIIEKPRSKRGSFSYILHHIKMISIHMNQN